MTASRIRQRLRIARQANRRAAIPPEIMKQHEAAAWIHILFGRPLEDAIAEVARFADAMGSKRASRAVRKQQRDAIKRQQAMERHQRDQKEKAARHQHRMQNDKSYAEKHIQRQHSEDLMNAARRVTRKGIT